MQGTLYMTYRLCVRVRAFVYVFPEFAFIIRYRICRLVVFYRTVLLLQYVTFGNDTPLSHVTNLHIALATCCDQWGDYGAETLMLAFFKLKINREEWRADGAGGIDLS